MDKSKDMLLDGEFYRMILDNIYDGVYFVQPDRTIIYWNESAERLTGFTREELIGKHCWEDVLMHVNDQGVNLCMDRCPCEKAMTEGVMVEGEAYLHHKEGHRVPVMIRVSPIRDESGSIIGAVQIFSDNSPKAELVERVKELERLALLDPLTRIGNRRYGNLSLAAKLNEWQRYGWSFGVLFMDIDRFKEMNDLYGNHFGDRVLKIVATTMVNVIRSSDYVSRWGGEEFVAFIPNADREQLLNVANKVRFLVEKSNIFLPEKNIGVTISVGATLARKDDTEETLTKRAEDLMHKSKAEGRNRVSMDIDGA
ncbi:MAG TPA: diguanylate cyclase [Syntrophorhabdaceae bacterium]|nr:diguanylate cyclase [Syntrophorhabdaceae bacterium]